MTYYALFYEADGDFVTRRAPYREEHLHLAQEAHARGELILAGAIADPIDRALLVFRGESPESAKAFAQKDPYVTNGLVKRWEVRPWNVVIGGDAIPATPPGTGDR
jgi:uncharacterized protein